MRRRFTERFERRIVLLPKFRYSGKYYDASDDLIERLEGDGYVDTTIVPLTTSSRFDRPEEIRRLKRAIDCVFKVYPKDERAEDGFEEIDVFAWDWDQEDLDDVERDIRLGRREPVYVAYDLGAVEDYLGELEEDLHVND